MTGPGNSEEAEVTEQILDQLSLYGRRVRGVVERIDPDLSFAEYSMLSHLAAENGCRAQDLVRAFGLDKSTVSRQLAGLVRRGLVERDDTMLLRVTPAGARLLRSTRSTLLDLLGERVSGWTAQERRTFAELLRRYNEAE